MIFSLRLRTDYGAELALHLHGPHMELTTNLLVIASQAMHQQIHTVSVSHRYGATREAVGDREKTTHCSPM